MGGHTLQAGQKRVFDSVFPSSRLKDLRPTPAATPLLGHANLGQSFGGGGGGDGGGFAISAGLTSSPDASNVYPEKVVWDRAWHSGTSLLSLPGHDFVTGGQVKQHPSLKAFVDRYDNPSSQSRESLAYLLTKEGTVGKEDEDEDGRESIVEWYTDHVREHFLAHSKPALVRVSQIPEKEIYSLPVLDSI